MRLRPVQPDRDRADIIALIDAVYGEYGDRVHLAGAESDLNDLRQAYLDSGGDMVVLVDSEQRVRGVHAVLPLDDQVCTFRRLYLDPSLRGQGYGMILMDWAVGWARRHGFRRIEFWSDTRFEAAHRFFQRCGFKHDGQVRSMNDGWAAYDEYFFHRVLAPGDAAN